MIVIFVILACMATASVWLRWAIIPVRIAYDLGREVERLRARSHWQHLATRQDHTYVKERSFVERGSHLRRSMSSHELSVTTGSSKDLPRTARRGG
jgi:hypothetical protein